MTTTVQQLADRAKAFSTANTSASITDSAEIIARVTSIERQLYAAASQRRPDFFLASTALTSTSGSSGRTADLSAVSPPVMRVLRVSITSTDETVSQVDVLDPDGDLAPRYYAKGQTLVEVSNDWGASGTVGLTVHYIKGPVALSTSGGMSQTVSIPDEWTDCLVLPLALYLAHKDVGRDPAELQRIEGQAAQVTEQFYTYLDQYAGAGAIRYLRSSPTLKRSGE